jgi:hypothetical protein
LAASKNNFPSATQSSDEAAHSKQHMPTAICSTDAFIDIFDPLKWSPALCCIDSWVCVQGSAPAGVMAGSRYPRRNRNTVLRPDSAQGSGQAASSSKDQEEESGSEQVQHQLLLQSVHGQRLFVFVY